jgi:hypothetical protein
MATAIATATTPGEAEFTLMQRQAALFASSPLIPAHLRAGSPQQAMANCYIAMTIADRMGEDRMTVMQNIHIVHGTAGFKAQYMIARANASGVFKDGIDWEISGKGNDLSVTAFATLASTERRVAITVDMAMAQAEGWTKNSKYKTMPEIMLRYRSGTFLVRMYAPQVMLGYQTVEEREDLAAATLPVAAPLTGQALLEQADSSPHPEPGELEGAAGDSPNDDAEGSAASNGPADEQSADAHNGTDEHPARTVADRIITAANTATTIIDLNSLRSDSAEHIEAMPEDLAGEVRRALGEAEQRLGRK